jgi:hypothetical protein
MLIKNGVLMQKNINLILSKYRSSNVVKFLFQNQDRFN